MTGTPAAILRRIIEEGGGLENTLREMALFRRDAWRLDSIAQDLTKEYPNHWAAMLNEEFIGVWKTHGALMRYLRRYKFDPSRVAIQFLEHPRRIHILKAA